MALKTKKIGIIGCGNMGGAIVRGLILKGLAKPGDILLNDKDLEKVTRLAKKTGCAGADIASILKKTSILVLAIKPQDFNAFSGQIASGINGHTIVSVMAGVKTRNICQKLGKNVPIARAMPNMAALIGESVTCVAFSALVKEKKRIKDIFSGIGKVVEVKEDVLDAVTALSGSGPAYLFYLADAMIKAGRHIGLDEKTSEELVIQTLYGAAAVLRRSGAKADELIKKVASKGGTTEAALTVFEKKKLHRTVKDAIRAAHRRSKQLSKGA